MARKTLNCQVCACDLEKSEALFVDEETFAFLRQLPTGVQLGIYCPVCFDKNVRAELDNYNDKLERAKNVNVFFLTQSKESRFVRRTEKPVTVKDCPDRDEVVLRLAFLAVEAGKNALVDVELSSAKVRNGRWQSSTWSGQAVPADITETALQRRFAGTPN